MPRLSFCVPSGYCKSATQCPDSWGCNSELSEGYEIFAKSPADRRKKKLLILPWNGLFWEKGNITITSSFLPVFLYLQYYQLHE
ncbi:hypothetical protein CIPAW_01G098900 [Carya illinoinensis]|uniref:Uncharacterized protein n=1 Tax=Carya illinoinensis TaxID=32201 RepID=A0A8T1RM60_CARIL|nr:hypothetical protein CIPAW_01G098900 [Carya illinoinensis]